VHIETTSFPGLALVHPDAYPDPRGTLVTMFRSAALAAAGLDTLFTDEIYSVSRRHVLRGMHFQRPPHAQAKLITCLCGAILDVVLDLRTDSPTFGQHYACELTPENHTLIHVPTGFAHGFLSLADHTVVLYKISAPYAPSAEASLRWDSFGFSWPCATPVLSDRDRTAPSFAGFTSPFP
jgi:dTDP-4-dehydrorhamnose 3,5-epimerase